MSAAPLLVQLTPDLDADRTLIGGKAASLLTLARIGAAVPPAFVLTTEAYRHWAESGDHALVRRLIAEGVAGLEARSGRRLGVPPGRLIVSVRSGAPVSMPGMMDTVLNAGIGRLAEGEEAFLHEARSRFLLQFAEIVLCVDEHRLAGLRPESLPKSAAEVEQLESTLREAAAGAWPETPEDELVAAAVAVFASWQSSRAKLYRRIRKIDDNLGTSVTVQQMAFGNRGPGSGSGVAFTRDPTSGADGLIGEYIQCGQGEEIVAGRETGGGLEAWRDAQPQQFAALQALGERLEADSGKVHEIEFTVEERELFVLQCRPALLTARGAARIAVEMIDEGRLSQEKAVAYAAEHGFDPAADPNALGIKSGARPVAQGLAVGGGVGAGRLALSPAKADEFARSGDRVVFATVETSPSLLPVMQRSAALLTMTGGATSHAAVVARELGTPCVVGLGAQIAAGMLQVGGGIAEGAWITIDGDSGDIFEGDVGAMMSRLTPFETRLREWAGKAPASQQA